MLRFIIGLLFVLATPVWAIDPKVITNPIQDGDVQIRVNDGGTQTTVLHIDGATSRVGIGTTTPQVALDVPGGIQVGSTAGNVLYNCTRFQGTTCTSVTQCDYDCGSQIVVGGGCVGGGTTNQLSRSFPVNATVWRCLYAAVTDVTPYAICCSQ